MSLPDYHDPTKPTVLLDVDGVLASFVHGALDCLFAITGIRRQHDDVVSYGIEDGFGLTAQQRELLMLMWSAPGFCRNLPPYREAVAAVPKLQAIANVYPVTAPFESVTWVHERDAWLKQHFGIPRKMVSHTEAKHLIKGDVFVDDKPAMVRAWQHAHPDGVAVLWHRAYNANEPGFRYHTNDWNDVIAFAAAGRRG